MESNISQHAVDNAGLIANKSAVGLGFAGVVVAGLTWVDIFSIALCALSIVSVLVSLYYTVSLRRKAIALVELQIEDELRQREVAEAHG